jgi:hypothetical protein
MALLAVSLAAPLLATVWTRTTFRTRLPKGGSVALEDLSYAGRDWNAALTALEVRQVSGRSTGSSEIATTWTFRYTNTDREPHYVGLTVSCLDTRGQERSRFKATITLLADRPGGATVDVPVKLREPDWNVATVAKVVADFLSGPEG